MKAFRPQDFLQLARASGLFPSIQRADADLPADFAPALRLVLAPLKEDCTEMQLGTSVIASLDRLLALEAPTGGEVRDLLDQLHGRLVDETKERVFLALSPQETEDYRYPAKKWQAVIRCFPDAEFDIEEAGRCLALGRNTACVFHLMRTVEVGLRALGASLNDPNLDPKSNPSWEAILAKCDQELRKPRKDRSLEWQADELFFRTATVDLRAVKEAWRNPTMHVERRYYDEEAREVWNAVRAFMRHLATKLSQRG
jgi:hypothetical protein